MQRTPSKFVTIALSNEVVEASLKTSFVVGTILALINHGPAILHAALTEKSVYQIILTFLVPYCVSTYSAVKAIQKRTGTNTYS